ncbi:MAG: AraC family transcriptional regulator [Brumimicrobium sp.]
MKLLVKYMVSHRCKMMVKTQLKKLQLPFLSVSLGVIELFDEISPEQREQLKINLKKSGLELLDDKHSVLIEKIENIIDELIEICDEEMTINCSDYISEKLDCNYTYLANIFSEVKGINLLHYILLQKIEKVKEMILYEELTLTEIAARMGYSSTAHLSTQFKNITGHTPTYFITIAEKRKEKLENV